jgi:ATP-dependent exoDNAse (exonuclease V) beta subunit
VLDECVRLHDVEGFAWSDLAILARSNDQLTAFAEQARVRGLPYALPGEQGLYRTDSVLDALALLRWVVGGTDTSLHVFRLLTHPHLGISDTDVLLCTTQAKATGRPLDAVVGSPPSEVSASGRERLLQWASCVEALRHESRRRKAFELFLHAVETSGLLGTIIAEEEPRRTRQFQALRQCADRLVALEALTPYGSAREVVDALDAEQELGETGEVDRSEGGPDEVQLLTMHKAKGLEFRAVFVTNLVNQRMPASRRSEALPLPAGLKHHAPRGEDPHIEEERRLFYVALTRAKERLYLTWAASYGGARAKNASPFLEALNLPPSLRTSASAASALTLPSPYVGTLRRAPQPSEAPLSFSQMRAFDACPLQYQFAHLWHVPTPKGKASVVGTVAHGVLEALFARWRECEAPPAQETVAQLLEERWRPLSEGSEEEQAADRQRLQAGITWVFDQAKEQGCRPLGVEVPFLGDVDGVVIRGRIDRVDTLGEGVELIDYKTGRAKALDDLTFDDKLQLLLYQLMAPQMFGVSATRLSLVYLMDQSMVSFLGTEKELEKARRLVREAAASIRGGAFVATPSERTCATCDYRHICPLRAV